MGIGDDPDAGKKAPAVPKKKADPPGYRPRSRTPQVGPNDPDNNPARYYAGGQDDGTYVGSTTMPGFIWGQADPSNKRYKPQDYRDWLNGSMTDPAFSALRTAYGDEFVAFMWWGFRTESDPNVLNNRMATLFPGYLDVIPGAGNGPSYGGGGGGMSKAQQIAAAEAEIRNQSQTLGLNFTDGDIKAIAQTVVKDSWSGAQLTDYLLADSTRATNPGSLRDMQAQIKAMGKAQLINVSDASSAEWAKRIMSGEMDIGTVGTILQAQATTEFSWASEQLVAGATMRDLLMPARDMIANELELAADTVDLMDTRWRDMAQQRNPDGTARAATLTEVQRAARKDSGWAKTNGAARLASQTAMMIRNVFEG